MENKSEERVFNARFIMLYILMMLAKALSSSNQSISAALASINVSAAIIGSLSTVFGIMAILLRVISGPATTAVRPNRMLCFALCVQGCAYLCYSTGIIQMFVVGKILDGIANAFMGASSMMILADTLPKDKYNTGIGFFTTRAYVGNTLGPILIFTVLVPTVGYWNQYRIVGICLILCGVWALTMKVREFTPQPFKIVAKNIVAPECIVPLFIMLSLTFSYVAIEQFLSAYAISKGVAEGQVGFIIAIASIVTIVVGPLGSILADKFTMRTVILPAAIIYAIGMPLLANANSFFMFALATIPIYAAFTVVGNIISAMCVQLVEPERRGVGAGTFSLTYDIGYMVGPITAGMLVDKFGYSTSYMLFLIPCALCLVFIFAFWKKMTQLDNEFHTKKSSAE